MRHVIETRNDIAAWCAFDPGAVKPDLPQLPDATSRKQLEALQAKNRLWLHTTGKRGPYLVHALIDEELPAGFVPHSKSVGEPLQLLLPNGTLCVCSAEEVVQESTKLSPKLTVSLPAGTYSVEAWEMEWPVELLHEKADERTTPAEVARRNRQALFGVTYLVATSVSLLGSLWVTFRWLTREGYAGQTVLSWWIAAILLLVVIPRFFPRRPDPDYEREIAVRAEFFPDLVLSLKPT